MTKVKENAQKVTKKERRNIRETEYGQEILLVNDFLKEEERSLGGARSRLLEIAGSALYPYQRAILKASKDKDNYKVLQAVARKTKSGKYSPFMLLQDLRKNRNDLVTKMGVSPAHLKVANKKGK